MHRDTKGDNVLVRPADGRLFLTDFGSGHHAGAARLTPLSLPPNTPAYRSPEAWEHARTFGHLPDAPYVARPADDVFAFGVMAYRLVTDEYPSFTDPSLEEGRCWRPEGGGPVPPKELNPRVAPRLDALILRMLSRRPEERGTARALAEAMEREAAQAGPEADSPLFEWETLERSQWLPGEVVDTESHSHRVRRREREKVRITVQKDAAARADRKPRARVWLSWLAVVTGVMALVLLPGRRCPVRTDDGPSVAPGSPDQEERDGGIISLGDSALVSSHASLRPPTGKAIALELPRNPLPGQLKPDASGRCHKGQHAINGGCWLKADVSLDECDGNGFVYKGACYAPVYPPGREPTSAPAPR